MNKEPIGLYIFRYILGFIVVILLSMIYWSSTLVEEDMKQLRSDMAQLKNDLFAMRGDMRAISERAVDCAKISASELTPHEETPKATDSNNNLLHPDPFYEKTLPNLLGKNFAPNGVLTSATVGKPESLHPFSGWADIASWYELCSVTFAKQQFGVYDTMCPYMAKRIEERIDPATDIPEFWIFLRNDVFWQPLKQEWFSDDLRIAPQFLRKLPVTAADFKFFYDAMMNPFVQDPGAVSLRTYYSAIDEFRVVDDHTIVIRWKTGNPPGDSTKPSIKFMAKQLTGDLRPLPSHVYQYFANGKKIIENDKESATYRTNSVWAHNFSQHWAKNIIVSCGPWVFDGMTEEKISFKRNADFSTSRCPHSGNRCLFQKQSREHLAGV